MGAALSVLIRKHEFRTDGGGAGEFRGGTGVVYEADVLTSADYSFRGEGLYDPSGFGYDGGAAGEAGTLSVTDKNGTSEPPQYSLQRLPPIRVSLASPGGGGLGDPRRRDPALVLRDFRDGVISAAAAYDLYRVAFAADGRSVDAAATARARRGVAARCRRKRTSRVFLAARPQGMPREADFGVRAAPVPEPRPTRWSSGPSTCRSIRICAATSTASIRRSSRSASATRCSPAPSAASSGPAAGRSPKATSSRVISAGVFAAAPAGELRKVDPELAPVSTALGVLGMPGMTAYFGMTEIARPRQGETVVVSAAAGAVGSAAGQIARILGSRVVGIVGSQAKAEHITKALGFDCAIDYRQTPDLHQALVRACRRRSTPISTMSAGRPTTP